MASELFILLALVLANGLFAGAEIAILTAANAKVQQRAAQGDRRALAVLALRDQPERFLATVQIGITVVGAAAGAFGGARIARDLAPAFEVFAGDRAHDLALAVVVAGVSFLSLVLGELVPKSLGLRYASGYAFAISRTLLLLSRVMRPLVWFFTACSNVVLRMFGDRTSFTEARVSRDELRQLVEEAAKTGSVDAGSSEIASRALDFADVLVSDVMVRRERIAAIPLAASVEDIQRILLEEGHSRMPVYGRDVDDVVGYVVARDVLALVWEQGLVVLEDIVRPIFATPMTSHINIVLREMQARGVQIAIVVDEFGGTAGMVTIDDLVEELIGDVPSEYEAPDQTVQIESPEAALVAGWVPVRKVNRMLQTSLPIRRDGTTMAGLCMTLAMMIPEPGTRLEAADGTTLEIVDASPRRVRMVRVHHHRQRTRRSSGADGQ